MNQIDTFSLSAVFAICQIPTYFKNIQIVPLKDKDMAYSITFIYQKLERLEPQARKFIEFIKNHTYDEGEGGLAPK